MLRQFHFIDNNGKDQGINVRNRSQELVKLLGDVDAIRSERKKARANRNKFGGIEGGMGSGGFSGSGGRYGGFGSDSMAYGGYSGGVYGDGGGFGGNTGDFQDSGRRSNRFEEYDEDEDETGGSSRRTAASPPPRAKRETKAPEAPKPAPVEDLFEFGDEPTTSASSTAAGKQPAGNGLDVLSSGADDDDFDDFQSAAPAPASSQFSSIPPPSSTFTTTSNTQFAQPKPVSATQGANLTGLAGFSSATSTPVPSAGAYTSPISPPISTPTSSIQSPQQQKPVAQQPSRPSGFQAATPNYYTSVSAATTGGAVPRPGMPQTSSFSSTTTTSSSTILGGGAKPAATKAAGGDVFGSLWSNASASAGIQKNTAAKGPNLASMAKEKSSAGIWGSPATSTTSAFGGAAAPQQQKPSAGGGSSAFDDLLG